MNCWKRIVGCERLHEHAECGIVSSRSCRRMCWGFTCICHLCRNAEVTMSILCLEYEHITGTDPDLVQCLVIENYVSVQELEEAQASFECPYCQQFRFLVKP